MNQMQESEMPMNMSQDELLEFIKKTIKNNSKHFQKDKIKDEIYTGLRA
jgi:hypothetical protein